MKAKKVIENEVKENIINIDISSNHVHSGKSLIVKLLMIILDQAELKNVQVKSDTLVASLIKECRDEKDMKEHLASVIDLNPTIIINEQSSSANLSSIESRYRDLLNALGVNGHDGALAEIKSLREKSCLETPDGFIEKIPRPVYKPGCCMLPPIYSLNEGFKDLVMRVKQVQENPAPDPKNIDALRDRLGRENEISSAVITIMDQFHSIVDLLQIFEVKDNVVSLKKDTK